MRVNTCNGNDGIYLIYKLIKKSYPEAIKHIIFG